MKQGQKIDLGMTGYDELFMNDEQRKENRLPKIQDVPISQIDDFPDHPFQVRFDEDMQQLVDSIKERGLITPIILRKKDDGRYEVVSGHRRKQACKLAGMENIKAEIREIYRKMGLYCLNLYDYQYLLLKKRGAVEDLGNGSCILTDSSLYTQETGLDLNMELGVGLFL